MVAMSMERLQIVIARIASITVNMIDLNPVVMLEKLPTRETIAATTAGQSCHSVPVKQTGFVGVATDIGV